MSLLFLSEIAGLVINTLTADKKYSFCNWENLQQTIQTQLSKKQKTFSQYFA